MQRTERTVDGEPEAGSPIRPRASVWLWFSLPIATLGIVVSLAGIFFDSVYARETENWAAQGVGQDIANLVMFSAMLVLAYAASKGSLPAYLAWTGTLAYSVYCFTIYTFDIHFGSLFLLYVAVYGMSIWTLIGALTSIDASSVKARFSEVTSVRLTAGLLIGLGAIFYLLWLSGVVPASIANEAPKELLDAGVPTNPVHVLDLSVFLPAMLVGGILLWKERAWGYVMAPMLLTATAGISTGIVALTGVSATRDLPANPGVGVVIGAVTVFELVVLVRFLRSIRGGAPSDRIEDPR